jgi:hypothetical protein
MGTDGRGVSRDDDSKHATARRSNNTGGWEFWQSVLTCCAANQLKHSAQVSHHKGHGEGTPK